MADRIDVVWGTGDAATRLTAFDQALAGAGVADYNLVPLSSIVPPDATVATPGRVDQPYAVGDPVAVVLARAVGDQPGETVAAGLGWALAAEGGVFMESSADGPDACRADLETKLADVRTRRDWDWTSTETVVRDHEVRDVGAAVVAAVYGPLAWADGT